MKSKFYKNINYKNLIKPKVRIKSLVLKLYKTCECKRILTINLLKCILSSKNLKLH